ncbi:hypothetical protein HK101_003982 [Irineochytrium annulatum]|nr:hypothetical protein HK101_003982 [Irineochytrium annulatum]
MATVANVAAAQGITACQYNMILQISSVFENGTPMLTFGSCANINDGNGFSAGFIQFTTGSGNAQNVVHAYVANPNSNQAIVGQFNAVIGVLDGARGNAAATTPSLQNFCSVWMMAAKTDPANFQAAQLQVQSSLFFAPNAALVSSNGIKTAAGVGFFFDTGVQLGGGGLSQIVASAVAAAKPPSAGGDEKAFLLAMATAKRAYINNLGGAYPATVTRINSYEHIINGGNLNFNGNAVEMLDNSGNPLQIHAMCAA